MERYAAVLNYAIPFFMALLLFERLIAHFKKAQVIHSLDTLSSLSSGITNVIKDVLGLTVIIISYEWFLKHLAITQIENTWLVYVLAFIGLDFAGYWNHRLQHKINYFWNVHIIHHSSEEFNLACALRQPISSFFATITFFLIPTAIIGVPQEVVAIVAPLHLFAQYWYHTRLIGKLGFLEKIIVTPSHHRVHHAINKEYLDKNLSQVFIIWDKLFGTFQEELDDVPPVYGVKRPLRTWNPILINFSHLWLLIQDAWRTHSIVDKLRIWFMPTGWRPRDVKFNYPVEIIQDPYSYEKYHPTLATSTHIWLWAQFLVVFLMMMHLFNGLTELSLTEAIIYGAFICLNIFSYATLMDKHKSAWLAQLIVAITAMGLILYQKDWFLLNSYWGNSHLFVIIYFWLSAITTAYMSNQEKELKDTSNLKMA